jgi:hypothetical protein
MQESPCPVCPLPDEYDAQRFISVQTSYSQYATKTPEYWTLSTISFVYVTTIRMCFFEALFTRGYHVRRHGLRRVGVLGRPVARFIRVVLVGSR